MTHSLHLLFPLLSSLLFVIAAMYAKRATLLGVSPFTATAMSNLLLATCWLGVGLTRNEWLPWEHWWNAAWIALTFVGGQLTTYLAFRLGDVSLATPVFGVKIIMVAFLSSLLAQRSIEGRVWLAAAMATVGVIVMQLGSSTANAPKLTTRRATLAIAFALAAATLLSLFDVGVQHAGKQFGAPRFLSTMFCTVGVFSLALLPWANSPAAVQRLQAQRPLLIAAILMALQAISITFALGQFGDVTRINIVYSLRGLWSVVLAWLLSRYATSPESSQSRKTMIFRFAGTLLLTVAIVIALIDP